MSTPTGGSGTTQRNAAQHNCYDYPRPALTVDMIVVTNGDESAAPSVLLIQRDHFPGESANKGLKAVVSGPFACHMNEAT